MTNLKFRSLAPFFGAALLVVLMQLTSFLLIKLACFYLIIVISVVLFRNFNKYQEDEFYLSIGFTALFASLVYLGFALEIYPIFIVSLIFGLYFLGKILLTLLDRV